VARLKPGIPLEQAQAELDGIAARLAARYPESNAGRGAVLVPLPELTVGKARSGLLALLWGAFLVLAIAVGNVANLTLSRYHARYQDLGVRLALGAGRLRLLATAFHETLLLALAASVLALAVAKPLVAFFVRVALEQESSSFLAEAVHELPRLDEVGVGLRAGTAAVLAALGISWLISLAPLCWLSEGRLSRALASGGKGRGGESSAAARLRRAVAIVEVGLAVGLTVLSLSLASSMARLRRVDPGFRTDHVLTLNLFLPVAQYAASGQTSRFYSEMLQRVEALPGVVSAGLTFGLPLSDLTGITDFGLDGPRGAGASKGENRAAIQPVSPRYFETVGVPLLSGRALAVTDAAGSLPVALINQALARRYFPGQNPVGERLFVDAQFGPVGRVPAGWKQIVGVVGDFRRTSLTGEAGPEIYLPYTQLTWRAVSLAIRTSIDPQALAVPVERELAAIDPLLAVSDLRPLADSVERSLAQPRFLALLSLVFAATAVLLALLGVYGIVAYSTQSRLHESGVRVACGAGAGEVVSRFLAEVTMLVLGGSLLGLVVVGAGELWLRGLPWVGSSFEPLSLVGVPLAFLALAWLASYRPIRVALSRNPLDSLR
nr:ABC transporter permease [Thermoanaerobaculia bacterium]